MTFEELKKKAQSLPLEPGVYIMRDKTDRVIYVGKAKKLKNRVSQYFIDSAAHTPKTRLMVRHIDHFDVIIAASEFEALVLECSQIKRYMPKYNILLKDDKGYPYIRLNLKEEYPRLTIASRPAKDGAAYYGPYGTRGVTNNVIDAIVATLKLPSCHRQFPAEIGKERPCLNYHMNTCAGWCRPEMTQAEYHSRMEQARQLLNGNYKAVADSLRAQMLAHADRMEFELAASVRDRLNAVEALGQKQLVTALSKTDTDAIGFASTEAKACFAVLHFTGGNLLDKDYETMPAPEDSREALNALVKQYYLARGIVPKRILLPWELEDAPLLAELLEREFGVRPQFHVPRRGDNAGLLELARKNAFEEAERITQKEEKISGSLSLLGKMLGIAAPKRMESYDISNISGTDIVASMVVFEDGRPKKSEYKKFNIEGLAHPDDYASMDQVLRRRFRRYLDGDKGFAAKPDLLLIDGGIAHANVALNVLRDYGLDIPIYGMVKDNRHRTRALVTPGGAEIGIDANPAVFSLIGNIQEETHRFAISFHRQKRSRRLQYSELDAIPGIGPKRKQELLKKYGSLRAISAAPLAELERLLPRDAARAVYDHFRQKEDSHASNNG
ncbi:MAG: excinuclease ABC subunit UvrC [Firmicutes bacterium]|nr:excinuclease ABC subunit UvrC [Bacillota bacterium]